MAFVFLWIGLAVAVGVLASRYDRSVVGWVALAIVFSPLIAGVILLAAGSRRPVAVAAARPTGPSKTCPRCAEAVQPAALVCRFCGYQFPPPPIPLPPLPQTGGYNPRRVAILAGVVAIFVGAALIKEHWTAAPARAPAARPAESSAQSSTAPLAAPRVWEVENEDSSTGGRNVYVSIHARDPVKIGEATALPKLTVRCMENVTSILIHFAGVPVADSDGFGRVTFRVDDGETFGLDLRQSSDQRALGLWKGAAAIPVIKGLFAKETLVVWASPYMQSTVILAFPIAGLEEAAAPLRQACSW